MPGESIFCSLCSMNSGLTAFCSLLAVIHSLLFVFIIPKLYSKSLILFIKHIFCHNSSKFCVPFVISYILNINTFMLLLNLLMVAFNYRYKPLNRNANLNPVKYQNLMSRKTTVAHTYSLIYFISSISFIVTGSLAIISEDYRAEVIRKVQVQ